MFECCLLGLPRLTYSVLDVGPEAIALLESPGAWRLESPGAWGLESPGVWGLESPGAVYETFALTVLVHGSSPHHESSQAPIPPFCLKESPFSETRYSCVGPEPSLLAGFSSAELSLLDEHSTFFFFSLPLEGFPCLLSINLLFSVCAFFHIIGLSFPKSPLETPTSRILASFVLRNHSLSLLNFGPSGLKIPTIDNLRLNKLNEIFNF